MERETNKFKTSGGFEVEIKKFITGRESRDIQSVFLSEMKMNVDTEGETKVSEITGEMTQKAQDKTLEMLIVSVNGNKENVLDAVLDMPKDDYEEVLEKVNDVSSGLGKKKK